ncbi:MAG: insulinase family protein, partial [Alphaproteobacteria bacterium]
GAIYVRDSLQAGARALGAALAVGRSVADIESWPERIGAVEVEHVNAAARAILRPERSVTGLLLPKAAP